jgi:hypothetical protein
MSKPPSPNGGFVMTAVLALCARAICAAHPLFVLALRLSL